MVLYPSLNPACSSLTLLVPSRNLVNLLLRQDVNNFPIQPSRILRSYLDRLLTLSFYIFSSHKPDNDRPWLFLDIVSVRLVRFPWFANSVAHIYIICRQCNAYISCNLQHYVICIFFLSFWYPKYSYSPLLYYSSQSISIL